MWSERPRLDDQLVTRLLASVCRHLGTDLAVVSEYADSTAHVRFLSRPVATGTVRAGGMLPLEQSLSLAAIEGRVGAVLPDVTRDRAARRLTASWDPPLGAFVAAPIRLPGGHLFGALCALHPRPLPGLDETSRRFLAGIADVISDHVGHALHEVNAEARDRAAIVAMLDEGGMHTVVQPIIDLHGGRTVGVEALTRFPDHPRQPPNLWFAAAARHGLGIELEAAAVSRALQILPALPAGAFLSVNGSPDLLESRVLGDLLSAAPADQLVVEVTEHVAVADYGRLVEVLRPLRQRGIRLAVDDAGSGYASLTHVVRLAPDIVKMDGTLTRDVDTDDLKQAMAASMVEFTTRTSAMLIAEAVETPQELAALQQLGVPHGQGYLFAAPGSVEDIRTSYPTAVPRGLPGGSPLT